MSSLSIHQPVQHGENTFVATLDSPPASNATEIRRQTRVPRIAPGAMLDLASDAILLCDPASMQIVCVNDSACRLLGYSQAQLCMRDIEEIAPDSDVASRISTIGEGQDTAASLYWNGCVSTEAGDLVAVDGTVRRVVAENGERLVAISLQTPVSDKSSLCTRPVAAVDELTGLPTRKSLKQRLEQLLDESGTTSRRFALLFVDLDGFKLVNDSYGHHVGDRVLACVAERLRSCTRPNDLVTRYGGDEFVIVVPRVECDSDASRIVERIHQAMQAPIAGTDGPVHVSASIGVAFPSQDCESPDFLIQMADRAMYREKRKRQLGVPSNGGRRI